MNGTLEDTGKAQQRAGASRRTRQNGFAIRAFRQKDGYSQTGLAEAVGLRQASLSEIESERVSATPETLNLLARALHIPPAAIARDHPDRGQ